MHYLRFRIQTNYEVIWLNISMNEIFFMNVLYSMDNLAGYHHRGFQRKLPSTKVKQIRKARPHKLHAHVICVIVASITINFGKTLNLILNAAFYFFDRIILFFYKKNL